MIILEKSSCSVLDIVVFSTELQLTQAEPPKWSGHRCQGWEQVKMRMEQLQAAKQKIQEMEESAWYSIRV